MKDRTPYELKILELEVSLINAAIAECNGIKSKAAYLLGIDRKTLYNKLADYEAVKLAEGRQETTS